MPPSPSAAVARAIASMPRDGSINDFTAHFLLSLAQQGFEIVAARGGQLARAVVHIAGETAASTVRELAS